MFDKLKKKKTELVKNFIDINKIKHYKLLKLIHEEITEANKLKLFTKKQQLEFINNCFELKKNIEYSTYIKFIRTYIDFTTEPKNINENNRSINVHCEISEDTKEEPTIKTQVSKKQTGAKDPFAKLKKLNEDN